MSGNIDDALEVSPMTVTALSEYTGIEEGRVKGVLARFPERYKVVCHYGGSEVYGLERIWTQRYATGQTQDRALAFAKASLQTTSQFAQHLDRTTKYTHAVLTRLERKGLLERVLGHSATYWRLKEEEDND